jgi:4-amino-4-deoxy-L-arabinose transferase-like glycosyltransferase
LFWLITGAAKGLGAMSEVAARLPSAFSGLFTIILVFFFGKRLYDERVGVFAALVLATEQVGHRHVVVVSNRQTPLRRIER